MYKYFKTLFYLGSIIICISIISCDKDIDTPPPSLPNDTIPIPGNTKPDPSDTVPLIRKLEEVYTERSFLHKIKTISFYYDNQKRVSSIGLKNYASSFDSGTIKLFYTANQTKPSKIISPNTQFSKWGIDNVVYDTTYFFYDSRGVLIKDSGYVMSFKSDNSWKQLITRQYKYINNSQFSVQMAKKQYDNTMQVFRIDTVQFNPDFTFDKIKILFQNIQMSGSNLAVIENVRHTGFLNPLAKLNISGLHYFWITTPNDFEILGNTNYKSIDRGNILPTYIDFASAYLPSTFFNSAYDVSGVFFYGDEFTIQVLPWPERADYPKSVKVKGSSSLPETEVIYNYYY